MNTELISELVKKDINVPNSVTSFSDPAYGKFIAEKLLAGSIGASASYYAGRAKRISENIAFTSGRQSMAEYMDRLNIDAKKSFINLDKEPPAIAPKFIEVIISRFIEMDEFPTVSAIDQKSKQRKKDRYDSAEFRMRMGNQLISPLEEQAGIPLEDTAEFTPMTPEQLMLWNEVDNRDEIENKFEKRILDAIADGGIAEFKRKCLLNNINSGKVWAYVYRDKNGVKRYTWIDPTEVVHGESTYDDLRDLDWIGTLREKTVTQARIMYPGVPEEYWYDASMKEPNGTQGVSQYAKFSTEFITSRVRPYDDKKILIFDFEKLEVLNLKWAVNKDSFGKPTIDEVKAGYVPRENDEMITKDKAVPFHGVYLPTTSKMAVWEKRAWSIQPSYSMHEEMLSYVGHIHDNIEMDNVCMAERMKSSIRQLTLIHLKIQQLISTMRPDSVIIDVDTVTDVPLGIGASGTSGPLEIAEIHDQTGRYYYKRKDDEGNQQSPPIDIVNNDGSSGKLKSLIEMYNFYLQRLQDDVGTNPYVEGSGVQPRMGMGVVQNQVTASNRATQFIYQGYLSVLTGVAKRFAVMEWYDIMSGVNNEKYETNASDYYTEFMPDLEISMGPTEGDRQFIEQLIQGAMAAKTISLDEGMKARRVAKRSVKMSEIYVASFEKQKIEREHKMNQDNLKLQGENTLAQVQQQAQIDAQLKNIEAASKDSQARYNLEGQKIKTMGEVMKSVIAESIKLGKEVPGLQNIIAGFMSNTEKQQGVDSMTIDQQIEQMQQQAQQMEEEQQEGAVEQEG